MEWIQYQREKDEINDVVVQRRWVSVAEKKTPSGVSVERMRSGIVAECAVVAFSAFALDPELASNQSIFVWLWFVRLCALRAAPLVLM